MLDWLTSAASWEESKLAAGKRQSQNIRIIRGASGSSVVLGVSNQAESVGGMTFLQKYAGKWLHTHHASAHTERSIIYAVDAAAVAAG
jgi:hypothetical protein